MSGVGLVSISGGHRPAVRVQVNPQALAAIGLNIDDLRTTIGQPQRQPRRRAISTAPAPGDTIDANDQLPSAKATPAP